MDKIEWKELVLHILNDWFLVRRSMYFILIKDIYFCNKKKNIMVKYQCSNKRIGDTISVADFMRSPLKHATHPDQMLQIGIELEKQLNNLKANTSQEEIKNKLTRFKKIFYNEGT